MSFLDTVARAKSYLREHGRVSLRGLKREFDLEDDALDELIAELVDIQQVAARQGKAIAWMGGTVQAGEAEPVAALPASAPTPSAEAERRQLTVLFCDLVSSTELASRLDPEDWREVVRGYQERAAEVVQRFDGHVAQYLGDGVLVYFGWPRAHEDDAERAVRAGLGIVDAEVRSNALPREKHGVEIAVRIGIHTGPVVVGEMGGGARRETLAMGDTTNVAARLQGIAEPNSVVMSAATLRLVSGIFLTRDLGERELKGLGPVHAYEAVQPSGVRSRLDVAAAHGLTPLVGREQELGLLEDRWAQVVEGRGQLVLVCGEAGIGKSRLVQAFRERFPHRLHTWLECRASPYTQDSALYPVLDLQRAALAFLPSDTPERKLTRLEAGLELAGFELATAVPIFASFHGLPLSARYAAPNLSPEGLRLKTLKLLTEWLLRLSRQQPVVLLVEDLHWIDPSTLEILGSILEETPAERVLMLVTYRPDFEPPWGARSNLTPILLSRLTRPQLVDLIRKAARGRALPDAWLDGIVRRSDGVPLFAEELTRAALESRTPGPEKGDSPELDIPETLQDSLMARLDALGPVKELAQLGSVLGREFSYDLLLAASPMNEDELRRVLDLAEKEELFYRRGTPPKASYLFKHALLRDAAYQSLLHHARRRAHRRVAETLVDHMPEVTREQPGLVAHHFAQADDAEKALPYLQRAAEEAAARSANAESVRYFEQALELVEQLGDTPERKRRELVLQVGIGAPLQLVYGYRTPATERAYHRALELCREVGDTAQLFQALWGLYSFHLVGSDLDIASKLGGELLAVAQREGDASLENLARLAMGVPVFFGGDFERALEHLERSIALYDLQRDGHGAYRYGQDPGVMAMPFAAFCHWFLGRPERALALSRDSLALARTVGHPYTTALAHAYAALLHHLMRDCQRALELAEDTVAIATEQAFPLWRGFGAVSRARALAELGRPEGCVETIQAGLADVAATGTVAGGPIFVGFLAETQELAGRRSDALGALEMALGLAETTGCRYWDAELWRRKGELLLATTAPPAEGERCLHKALEIARRQRARLLELRAATSLACLWQRQDKREEARELLQPVYDRFTEGCETQDLRDAKVLLDELSPGR
ncbi:MAG: AAA family ATPase [Deltaproteobacteria bacterium]|nr:AAA family ATPase [Deltaproteobacteria bacterium]